MSADKEYHRQYYQANKDRIKERNRLWRNSNKEKVRAIQQKWWLDNKEKAKEKHKEWLSSLFGFLTKRIQHLKKAKRSRILIVDIDAQFLLSLWEKQEGKCAISGYPMTYPECTLFSISVDRVDPQGGYTKDNVQLVCQGINFAKNKYSNSEIIEFWNYRERKQK